MNQEKVLCIVDLALPANLAWRPHPLEEVLQMCAVYCWNPVDRKFNFDEAHRNTVQRSGQITICTDPTSSQVRLQLEVPPGLTTEVVEFTRATWRDLRGDMKDWGGPLSQGL